MFTLRCTRKLLIRMHRSAADLKGRAQAEPTTALGDWYANLLLVQRQHLVLLVNERSRLLVLTPAKNNDRLQPRFQEALQELLRAIGVPDAAIAREIREMETMDYGLTTDGAQGRSVLGSMNDYTYALCNSELAEQSLSEWNLHFSTWICGPLGYGHPAEAARRLLDEALSREPDAKEPGGGS